MLHFKTFQKLEKREGDRNNEAVKERRWHFSSSLLWSLFKCCSNWWIVKKERDFALKMVVECIVFRVYIWRVWCQKWRGQRIKIEYRDNTWTIQVYVYVCMYVWCSPLRSIVCVQTVLYSLPSFSVYFFGLLTALLPLHSFSSCLHLFPSFQCVSVDTENGEERKNNNTYIMVSFSAILLSHDPFILSSLPVPNHILSSIFHPYFSPDIHIMYLHITCIWERTIDMFIRVSYSKHFNFICFPYRSFPFFFHCKNWRGWHFENGTRIRESFVTNCISTLLVERVKEGRSGETDELILLRGMIHIELHILSLFPNVTERVDKERESERKFSVKNQRTWNRDIKVGEKICEWRDETNRERESENKMLLTSCVIIGPIYRVIHPIPFQ